MLYSKTKSVDIKFDRECFLYVIVSDTRRFSMLAVQKRFTCFCAVAPNRLCIQNSFSFNNFAAKPTANFVCSIRYDRTWILVFYMCFLKKIQSRNGIYISIFVMTLSQPYRFVCFFNHHKEHDWRNAIIKKIKIRLFMDAPEQIDGACRLIKYWYSRTDNFFKCTAGHFLTETHPTHNMPFTLRSTAAIIICGNLANCFFSHFDAPTSTRMRLSPLRSAVSNQMIYQSNPQKGGAQVR